MHDGLVIVRLEYIYTSLRVLIVLILIHSSNSNNNITYRYDLTHTSSNLSNLISSNSVQKGFVVVVLHESHVVVLLHSITGSRYEFNGVVDLRTTMSCRKVIGVVYSN